MPHLGVPATRLMPDRKPALRRHCCKSKRAGPSSQPNDPIRTQCCAELECTATAAFTALRVGLRWSTSVAHARGTVEAGPRAPSNVAARAVWAGSRFPLLGAHAGTEGLALPTLAAPLPSTFPQALAELRRPSKQQRLDSSVLTLNPSRIPSVCNPSATTASLPPHPPTCCSHPLRSRLCCRPHASVQPSAAAILPAIEPATLPAIPQRLTASGATQPREPPLFDCRPDHCRHISYRPRLLHLS